jgi:hypothetical protein
MSTKLAEISLLVEAQCTLHIDEKYPDIDAMSRRKLLADMRAFVMWEVTDRMIYEWMMNPPHDPNMPMGILSQAEAYVPPIVANGGGFRIDWTNGRETVTRTTSYAVNPDYGTIYDLSGPDLDDPPVLIWLDRPRRPDAPIITTLYVDEKGRPCLMKPVTLSRGHFV